MDIPRPGLNNRRRHFLERAPYPGAVTSADDPRDFLRRLRGSATAPGWAQHPVAWFYQMRQEASEAEEDARRILGLNATVAEPIEVGSRLEVEWALASVTLRDLQRLKDMDPSPEFLPRANFYRQKLQNMTPEAKEMSDELTLGAAHLRAADLIGVLAGAGSQMRLVLSGQVLGRSAAEMAKFARISRKDARKFFAIDLAAQRLVDISAGYTERITDLADGLYDSDPDVSEEFPPPEGSHLQHRELSQHAARQTYVITALRAGVGALAQEAFLAGVNPDIVRDPPGSFAGEGRQLLFNTAKEINPKNPYAALPDAVARAITNKVTLDQLQSGRPLPNRPS